MARAILNLRHGSIDAPPGSDVLDAKAVRQAFAFGRAWFSLGRYEAVELAVEDRRALLSPKPMLAARLLARGDCAIVDRQGGRQALSWPHVAVTCLVALRDRLLWPAARRRVEAALAAADRPRARFTIGAGPPLYLRTDLWYGLLAGGSIGHTAGVVKGLAACGLAPVLAAPERVPTVPDDIAMLPIGPRRRVWPVSDWQLLEFNLDCRDQVLAGWRGPPPRFVYHRHALYSFAGLALARHWGVGLVLEYNGPEVWVAHHWGHPLAEDSLAAAAELACLRRADLIAVVSNVLKQDLVAAGIDARRIAVVPNSVDTSLYRPDIASADLRVRLGLSDRLVVGFIGTFGAWHGVEILVEAFARLLAAEPAHQERLALLLVGDGVRMAAVRAKIARYGLGGSVVTTGLVPQHEGPAHLACFDIAVAPTVDNPDGSDFFGSPTKLFEYLAMGRPVVASAVGQVAEIVEDGETGLLVPAGDTKALAEALARLADDPALRARLGAAARAEAVRRHGHQGRIAGLLQAFEQVLELPSEIDRPAEIMERAMSDPGEREATDCVGAVIEEIHGVASEQATGPLAAIRDAAARLEQDEGQRYAVTVEIAAASRDALARLEADSAARYEAVQASLARVGEWLDPFAKIRDAVTRLEQDHGQRHAVTVEIAAASRDALTRLEADSVARYEAVQASLARVGERLDRRIEDVEAVLQRLEALAGADHDAIARIEADAGRRFEASLASRSEVMTGIGRLEQLIARRAAAPAEKGSEWVELDVSARATARTRLLRTIVADAGLTSWAETGPILVRNDLGAPSALAAANSAIADFLAERARVSADERLLWIVPITTDDEISDEESDQIFGLLGRSETIRRATVDGRGMLLVAGARRREEVLPLLRWSPRALDLAAGGRLSLDSLSDDIRRCLVPVFDLPEPNFSGEPEAWAARAAMVMDRFKVDESGADGAPLYGVTVPIAALEKPFSLDPWLAALRSALGGEPVLQWIRDPIPVARSGEVHALAERLGVAFDLTATTRDMSGGAFAAYDEKAAYRPMHFDLRVPSPLAGSLVCIPRRDVAAGVADRDPYAASAQQLAARLRQVLRRDETRRFSQAVITEPRLMAGQWELHHIYNWRPVSGRFTQAVTFDAELDLADSTSFSLAQVDTVFDLFNATTADLKTILAIGSPPIHSSANRDLQIAEHAYLIDRLAPSADSLRLISWFPDQLGETLELGSGYGVLAKNFVARTSRYVAIDLMLAQGQAIRQLGGLPLIADMHALPLPDALFDTVIADNVIEHATDPVAALKEVRRVLMPGGRGFLVLPLDYLGPDYRNASHHWKADVDSIRSAMACADLQIVRHEVCILPAIGAKGSFPSCNQRTSLWEVQRLDQAVSRHSLTLDFRAEARAIDPAIAALAERTSEEIVALNADSRLDGLARKSPSLRGFDWSSYIRLSELRFARACAHLARRGAAGRVLDLGAYFGNLSLLLARCGWAVTALDSYEEYGEAFSRHVELMQSHHIDVRDFAATGFDLAGLQPGGFDAVCCMGVIEHIPHTPRLLLAAIDSVLKPGGWLVLDTPNLGYDYQRAKLAAGRSIFAPLAEQFETDIPFAGHHREYTASEVRWMMERIGYQDIAIDLFNFSIFGLTALAGEDLARFEAMDADPERRELIMAVARKPADRGTDEALSSQPGLA